MFVILRDEGREELSLLMLWVIKSAWHMLTYHV